MANFILVLIQLLFFMGNLLAHEGSLGEKKLDSYGERYYPIIFYDAYLGKLNFQDEIFFKNFLSPWLFPQEKEFLNFLKSELAAGNSCPDELLSKHLEVIRYSYRLITLSYLIEAQWQLSALSSHLGLKNGCGFELEKWAHSCRPKSTPMKKFVEQLIKHGPSNVETFPVKYKSENWEDEQRKNKNAYSHFRLSSLQGLGEACRENNEVMDLICHEQDDLYGLSGQRDAYYLLGRSNIINTYNGKGEAIGCLRRFAEVFSHREVKYPGLHELFPSIQDHLKQKFDERFLQGRVFLLGAGKEFEDKGLRELMVKSQKLNVPQLTFEDEVHDPLPVKKKMTQVEGLKVRPVPEPIPIQKKYVVELPKPSKSSFLLAAEVRKQQNLERVEVDMLKLKYDYIFSLNMLNTLSDRLKLFMTRDALKEMVTYDRLGTKEAPVPLLFLKYMIDMEEHQGLWNILSVLGDKIYVSNEIDMSFKPSVELIQLMNEPVARQWQFFILKP